MDIEMREITDTNCRFILSGVNPGVANAMRRALLSEVPKMSIEDVEFHLGPIRDEEGNEYESMSPLFDEIVAHRLGLVPLPTDLSLFVPRDECTCEGEGCPNCTIMFALNKKGPCTVYSGDLEPLGDARLAPVDDLIPIVKLDKGQALLVYATAILGKGKDHVKWQVAHGAGYKYYPSVEIDQKKCDRCGQCVEMCPVNIIRDTGKKLVVEDIESCLLCNTCEEICEVDAVKVTSDDSKLIFQFETDGSLKAKEVMKKALDALEEQYGEFRDKVSTLKD